MDSDLELQISSTTLGYEGESGTVGAALALVEGTISKSQYTDIITKNAQEAEAITQKEFPQATFGVSVLASAVKPEQLKDNIKVGSVDYPYLVNFDRTFLEIKKQEVEKQGRMGIGKLIALAQEYGYGALQSHSNREQIMKTLEVAQVIETGKPRIRTSLDTVLNEQELQKMKLINHELGNANTIIWAIEPNKKIGDGNLDDYVQRFLQIRNDPANRELTFGIDLDLGGLPSENRNLFELLDILDSNKLLPIFISLSGQENIENKFRTHLPLGNDVDFGKKLGEWIKTRQIRGLENPTFVVETSPADQNVLKDYANFLANLKAGTR